MPPSSRLAIPDSRYPTHRAKSAVRLRAPVRAKHSAAWLTCVTVRPQSGKIASEIALKLDSRLFSDRGTLFAYQGGARHELSSRRRCAMITTRHMSLEV